VLLWVEYGLFCEQYVDVRALQVDSSIVGCMEYITVNSMLKVLCRKWIVVLWFECSVLQ